MLHPNFVFLGITLNAIGSSTYVWATIKGRTRPNRVTWLLWALAPLIAFAAEVGEGVGVSSLMTFMVGFSPLCVFVASFINRASYWKITRLDVACGALSVAALVMWSLTRTAAVAIVFSVLADAVAGVPTVIKAYREPATESGTVFLTAAISAAITMLTLDTWGIADAAFPLYIFLIGSVLFVLITFPQAGPQSRRVRTARIPPADAPSPGPRHGGR
jgi:hypothetical protein